MTIEEIRQKLDKKRFHYYLYKEKLDDVVKGQNIVFPTLTVPHPLLKPDKWKKCWKKQARETIYHILRYSLAYRNRRSKVPAHLWGDEIMALFDDDDYLYFDNGFQESYGFTFSPLTEFTFDRGILFLGKTMVGLFIIAEDD